MNITFEQAQQILRECMETKTPPVVADEDVAVFTAAFCKLYHPMWAHPERQQFLKDLCSFKEYPQAMIVCEYSHDVLFQGATRIEPDMFFYQASLAAKFMQKDENLEWVDAFKKLKEEQEKEEKLLQLQ